MSRVVITGAGGFIGRALTKYLVEKGIIVYAIASEPSRKNIVLHDCVIPVHVDISNKKELSNCFKDIAPDICYHLAWSGVSTSEKNNLEKQVSNIETTLSVINACSQAGYSRVVVPGSSSEYAYCGEIVTGSNIPAPGDAYAATKAATEVLCKWYAKQLNIHLNWLLIGSIYGPGRNDNNILTYTIKALLNGEEPSFTKLEQMWDYIYIDDLVEALYCVGIKGKSGVTYPIGSGDVRPLAEYIMQVKNEIAPMATLGIGKIPYKNGSKPDNSVLDISALKQDTDFLPKVSFEEGIKKTIQYFRECYNIFK